MKEGSGGDEQGNKIEERVLEDNRKTRKVLMEMKKRMEERGKQERKRNIVIRWIEKREKEIKEEVIDLLGKKFGIVEKIET